ncbi:MAG: Secretion system C-terminal sorting domain [Bacteroidota bacterium]|jgi:hypothetical protein
MAKQLTLLSFMFLITIDASSHALTANRLLQDALDFDNLPPNQIAKLQLIADDHWNSYAGRNAMEILNLYYDGEYDIDPMISGGAKNSKRSGAPTTQTLTVLRVYPNPANEYVLLEVPQEFFKSGQSLIVVDNNGKEVFHIVLAHAKQQVKFEVGQWAAGLYQISLLHNNRIVESTTVNVVH